PVTAKALNFGGAGAEPLRLRLSFALCLNDLCVKPGLHFSSYPSPVFCLISFATSAAAADSSANDLVLLCPVAPIFPQRVVSSLAECDTSQNLLDLSSTNSK